MTRHIAALLLAAVLIGGCVSAALVTYTFHLLTKGNR